MFVRMHTKKQEYGINPIPKWDGGFDAATGNNYAKPIWPKLVDFFMRVSADPFEYMRVQFAETTPGKIPYPNMLSGEAALLKWRSYARNGEDRMRWKIDSDFNSLAMLYLPLIHKLAWTPVEAAQYALRDMHCPASALVKYIVAVEFDVQNLLVPLERSAVTQLAFEFDMYEKVIGSRIPATIRDKAISLRQYFSS